MHFGDSTHFLMSETEVDDSKCTVNDNRKTTMDRPSPLVSVCIPTYNSETYLKETVESVLNQSHRNIEILISDGGSSDSTLQLISQMTDSRIRLERSESRLLPWENWTKAIRMAKGDYTMLLCHDDLLLPGAVSHLLGVHRQFQDAIATAGKRLLVKENGSRLGFWHPRRNPLTVWNSSYLLSEICRTGTNPIGEGLCVLWKTEMGPREFTSKWSYYIDLDYWLQLSKSGPIYQTNEIIGSFRVTRSSWTSQIGMKVSLEIFRFFDHLYQSGKITRFQRLRGTGLGIVQGIMRPVLQIIVNRS
jgi:glycosyltransferase involved in cell wall biosynthesis